MRLPNLTLFGSPRLLALLLVGSSALAVTSLDVDPGILVLQPFAEGQSLEGFPNVDLFAAAPIWDVDEAVLIIDATEPVERLLGVDLEQIQSDVTDYLAERGVSLLAPEAAAQKPGTSMLSLELNASTIRNSGRVGFHVSLSVKQICVPVYQPRVATVATIWRASDLGVTQGVDRFRARSLNKGITRCLGEFLQVRGELKRRYAALETPAPASGRTSR